MSIEQYTNYAHMDKTLIRKKLSSDQQLTTKKTLNRHMFTIDTNNTETSNELEKIGQSIYESNKHMRNIANIMEHPEMKQFMDILLGQSGDADVLLMFTKLYHIISKKYPILSGYQKIAVVKKLMDDTTYRQLICKHFDMQKKNWKKERNQIVILNKIPTGYS